MNHSEHRGLIRRSFLKTSLFLGSGSLLGGERLSVLEGQPSQIRQQIDNPVAGAFDVVVAGSGPAGITAALAAARRGAKTLVIEKNGCLGGIWTAGLLCWILDSRNKKGILVEIQERLLAEGVGFAERGGNGAFAYDPEAMKWLLEEMCREAGVTVRLGTWVVSGIKADNRLTHVVTESKSGREAWQGQVFIDCTGDGDLAARVGCGFDLGESETEATQPMSLLALVGGPRLDSIKPFVRTGASKNAKQLLRQEIERSGVDLSYKRPGLYPLYDDLYMLMANHQYEVSAIDADHLTQATMRGRRETNQIVKGLRSLGEPWGNLRLVATANQIGVREGRRIHGLYTVTTEDLIRGARHDDAVCRVTFGVDVHSTTREQDTQGKGYSRGVKSRPYDIPLRALIARDVQGLMMAGRCISGDFISHSSYRVTGNSVPMGEAAGQVAAIAALAGQQPQEVPNASWRR
jgi:hypothetical protein